MNRAIRLTWCILVILALGLATARSAPPAGAMGSVTGTWVVTKAICNHCQAAPNSVTGKRVVIDSHSYTDPFNMSCAAGATYVTQVISRVQAQAMLNVPRAIYDVKPQHVTLVALTCPESFGTNAPVALRTASLLLIDPNTALYPWAYDSSLLLTRVAP